MEVTEDLLNYQIAITTDTDTIRLTTQQKELSEFRSSGTLASGVSFLNTGAMSTGLFHKSINWHRKNLDGTLAALKSVS